MATTCKFCNSLSFGSGCFKSSHKHHEHSGVDEKHCVFCNSMSYGRGCSYGPSKVDRHGSDANKYVYCGSASMGRGCLNSLHKNHER